MKIPILLLEDFGGHKENEIISVDYEIYTYLIDKGIGLDVDEEELDELFEEEEIEELVIDIELREQIEGEVEDE